ncbi:hypothetical protein EMCG_04657 [[Emmonsia] crescens]|uniref:Uncharacterized protein n=1 Tax=[Emmonsia] crescens TaxID=73230 RepID=A0A0G2HRM8_9EURO|nr:hypothetical protein EMCG_04657 [Emmonsia crescens UAMH 3008]
MRTRSQPISPSGFQSLETAPRRKKAQTSATASKTSKTTKTTKTTKPAKETSAKVEEKKPEKRGPKKTSKKTASKPEEIPNRANNSNDAPAPAPTDDTSVNGPQYDVKDVATNQEPAEESSTDKCEQPPFSSTSPLVVATPVDVRPVTMDTVIPSPISSQQVGSQNEHKRPPSLDSLHRTTPSTQPQRFTPRLSGSSIPQTNVSSSSEYFLFQPTDNRRESSSSGTEQILTTNAPNTPNAPSAPALSECPTRHSYPPVSLSGPRPSRPAHRTSTCSLDRSDPQRASRSENDHFLSHSQPHVPQGRQAGLGVNFPSVSLNSRSSALDISHLGLENHTISQCHPPPAAQDSGTLVRLGSILHPEGSRTFCQNIPTSRGQFQPADRAAHSLPESYFSLYSSPFAPSIEPCQAPLPSSQLNAGSSARFGHSYHSPDFIPFEPFPRNRVYRSWESQATSRAPGTTSDVSGNILPFATPPRTTSTGTQTSPTLASGMVPKCPCCSATLTCPDNKHHITPVLGVGQPKRPRTLTKVPASPRKKRARLGSRDDDDDLRSSKKRRDVGTSSIARHRQRRVAPYAERSRRRAVESQGRIDKTLFRIPQLIAQNKADRDATGSDKTEDTDIDEPAWDVLNQMRADAAELSDQERPRSPQAPQTPTRNWGIRGLFNSVPRSISKFIPTFNLSPVRIESSTTEVFSTPPEVGRRPGSSTPLIGTPDQGEQPEHSEQSRDFGNLTYSLFPQPLNRRQLLGGSLDVPSPKKDVDKALATEAIVSKETESDNTQHASNNNNNNSNNDSSKSPRKRKHYIPESIPNPPGTSYGMDLRYFVDSSLSEPDDNSMPENNTAVDAEQVSVPIPATEQAAIRGILRGTKRVRFDASPENTPSKLRLRHPQPQTIDEGHQITEGHPSSLPNMDDPMNTSSEHSTGEPSIRTPPANVQTTPSESIGDPQPSSPSPPIIRPNPFGTYCLDYDLFSDDDDLYEEEIAAEEAAAAATRSGTSDITANQAPTASAETGDSATSSSQQRPVATHEPSESRGVSQPLVTTPEAAPVDSQTSQPSVFANNWTQPPPPRPTPAHASLPPQPTTPVDADAVAKLRSQAEKYKPKLPSGLRASRRYSSSPLSASDSGDNMASQPERFEPPYVPNPQIKQLVRDMWMEEDDEAADEVFSREFRRFRQEKSRLEESELEEGEGEEEGEEEEGAAHIEPFNLGSYDEFCQRLGEYRRGRVA